MSTDRKILIAPWSGGQWDKIVFLKLVLDFSGQLGNILLKTFFYWEALNWCKQSNKFPWPLGAGGHGKKFVFLNLILDSPGQLGNILRNFLIGKL